MGNAGTAGSQGARISQAPSRCRRPPGVHSRSDTIEPMFERTVLPEGPRVISARGNDVSEFADLRGRSWAYNDACSLSGYYGLLRTLAEMGEDRQHLLGRHLLEQVRPGLRPGARARAAPIAVAYGGVASVECDGTHGERGRPWT